jgi:hypothetical protein
MDLVFKNNDAANILTRTADAKCQFKLVSAGRDMATLQLIVTVDGTEVMFSDTNTTLCVGDLIEVAGATLTLKAG